MTEAGPFRNHLRMIGVDESNECRLCRCEVETAHHLIFECTGRPNRPVNLLNCKQYEIESSNLIKELSRLV